MVKRNKSTSTNEIVQHSTKDRIRFVGREEELSYLFHWIERGDDLLQITGPGGIGKTSLGQELVRQLQYKENKFQNRIVWIDCDETQHTSLNGIFDSIYEQLGLDKSDQNDNLRKSLLNYLAGHPTLLIFDTFEQVESNDSIIGIIVNLKKVAKVIVICRYGVREFYHESKVIELTPLNISTVYELLRRQFPNNLSESDAERIYQLASGSPLYIDLIINWLIQGNTLANLLEADLPGDRLTNILVDRSLFSSGRFSINEQEILRAASFFNGPSRLEDWAFVADIDYSDISIDKLRSQVFVKTLPNGKLALHDQLRLLIRQQLSEEQLQRYKRRYIDLYKSIIETKDQTLFENDWSNVAWTIELALQESDANLAWGLITNLNDFLFASGKESSFIDWTDKVIEIATQKGDQTLLASVVNNRSKVLTQRGRLDEAIKGLEQLLNLQIANETPSLKATILNNLATIYTQRKDYNQGLRMLTQSLSISREIGDRRGELLSLGNLASIYYEKGLQQKSLAFLEQTLFLAREIGDRFSEANALGQKARIYESTAPTSALLIYQEQLALLREIGNKSGELRTLDSVGELYFSQNKYDLAERKFLNALELSVQLADYEHRAQTLNRLAEIRRVLGDLSSAMTFANEGLRLAEQQENKAEIARSSIVIGDCRKELRRYDDAIYLFQRALQIYLEDKVTQPIALLYLKLAEVYEVIYQEQNKPGALETAIEDYKHAQIRADELKQKDTSLTAQIQLGGLYIKAYRQSGEQKYYEIAMAILNGIDSSIEKNEILFALLQENFGQAYYARYERTKEKDWLVKAQDNLQKAFDFAVSKNNLVKWIAIAPVLSLVYFQLKKKVDWNKIWDFGLQSIQGISRSSDTYYVDRVASVIADSAQTAFKKGEQDFALQQLVAISGYFERAGLKAPDVVHLALDNFRIELGDEKFALLYAGAKGKLASGIAPLLEESRTLMGNQQFDTAAQKLGEALNLLADDGKEEYKRQKATILFLRGLCLREQQLWEIALQDQEQAFELYAALKDLIGQAHVLLEIGYLYEFMNSYEDARLHYIDAYRLYKKVDEKKGLASAAEHLGTLEFRVRMYPQAVENLKEARKLYIELGEQDKASSLDADIIDAKAGLREQGINLEESHD